MSATGVKSNFLSPISTPAINHESNIQGPWGSPGALLQTPGSACQKKILKILDKTLDTGPSY